MKAHLRYGNHEIALAPGSFVIGRSRTCNLVLDDKHVSRLHAKLFCSDLGLTVEDLGSRAGVHVNRRRISGVQELHHGDALNIGQHSLLIVVGDAGDRDETLDGLQRSAAQRFVEVPTEDRPAGRYPPSSEVTHPSTLLQEIAQRALFAAEPSLVEAEWAVDALCRELTARLSAGGRVDPQLLDLTTLFSIRLAELTQSPKWSRDLFELNRAAGRIVPEPLVTAIETAASKGMPLEGLTEYLELARELDLLDSDGPARLARLERLTPR